MPIGLCHGDFSPGNLIFVRPDQPASNRCPNLSGIIDWDCVAPDGPAALDPCHLAITMRMLLSGDEMGLVVRELLERPLWRDDERQWLRGSASIEPQWTVDATATRMIVLLAWLRHVQGNLMKADRYRRNRLWVAVNVDWVLHHFAQASSLE